MARRSKGEGSIRKRPDGRWEARVTLPDGRRKSIYGKTRKEVARKLAIATTEVARGQSYEPSKVRVGAFLETWLADTVTHSVRASTLTTYENQMRSHLIPHLGHLRLADLGPQHIQRMIGAMLEEGLSPSFVYNVRGLLNSAMKQAVAWQMISANPVRGTSAPRPKTRSEPPWTLDEARAFLAAVEGDPLEALWYLALSLGLRKGELIALRWIDLDLDAATLTVARTGYMKDYTVVFGEPKTPRSRRTLRLPARAAELLKAHREQQEAERALADDWQDHGLVFTADNGMPLRPNNLWSTFTRRTDAAGLPRIRFHDLRHACATFLLASGVDITVVSEILGHSSIAITADLYAHVLPTLRDEAARRIQAALEGPKGSNEGSSGEGDGG